MDKTDPLAERLQIAIDCWRRGHNTPISTEVLAREVRAFLAERVTAKKVADALLNVRTSGRPLSVNVRGQLEAAVLALLRREVGG